MIMTAAGNAAFVLGAVVPVTTRAKLQLCGWLPHGSWFPSLVFIRLDLANLRIEPGIIDPRVRVGGHPPGV